MADGSRSGSRRTSRWSPPRARLVAAAGVEVEGELGHLAGGEDVARAAAAEGLTDPGASRGSSSAPASPASQSRSGTSTAPTPRHPALDWERLAEIRRADRRPHLAARRLRARRRRTCGARSSLAATKVNVNLELRQAYLARDSRSAQRGAGRVRPLELHDAADRSGRRRGSGKDRTARRDRMTPIRRLDHVAIAVRDTDAAVARLPRPVTGSTRCRSEEIERPHVRLTYVDCGNCFIQLVEPLDPDGPDRRLSRRERRGPTPRLLRRRRRRRGRDGSRG